MLGFFSGIIVGGAIIWISAEKVYGDRMDKISNSIDEFEDTAHKYRELYVNTQVELSKANNEIYYLQTNLKIANEKAAKKIDPVMKEAAKKAMMASHPDITRKHTEDDFIKFKRLYDSLK